MNEATATSSDTGLRLDLGIRGVWQPQVEALFDVRVIDTDAPSHCHRAPNATLESSSQEKKRMYKKAIEDRRGTFTPFVLSVDGLPHFILKAHGHCSVFQVGQSLFHHQQLHQITARFCRGLSSEPLSYRGSRTKWRSGLGFDDGAPLASFME